MNILCIESPSNTPESASSQRFRQLVNMITAAGDNAIKFSLPKRNGRLSKVIRLFFDFKELRSFCCKNLTSYKIGAILCQRLDVLSILELKKISKKFSVPLVIDCVEYASAFEKKLLFLSPSFIINRLTNDLIINKAVRTLSISKAFQNRFLKRGIRTAYVPNLVDGSSIKLWLKPDDGFIRLCFVGYPRKKDSLDIVVEGILSSELDKSKVKLNVAGICENDFYRIYPKLRKFSAEISKFSVFYGRVDHNKASEIIKESNFSVLMRNPKLINCKYGFPTKLKESFEFSTAVIANITSDLGFFIVDGVNGYIVPKFSADSFSAVFDKILRKYSGNEAGLRKLAEDVFTVSKARMSYQKFLEEFKGIFR